MAVALSISHIPPKFDFRKAAREVVESKFPEIYWDTAMRFFDRLAAHRIDHNAGGKALHAYSVLWNSRSYLEFIRRCNVEPFGGLQVEPVMAIPASLMAIPKGWVRRVAATQAPGTKSTTVAPVTENEIHSLFFDHPRFGHLTDEERFAAKRRALSAVNAHVGDPESQRTAFKKVIRSVRRKPRCNEEDGDAEPRVDWCV